MEGFPALPHLNTFIIVGPEQKVFKYLGDGNWGVFSVSIGDERWGFSAVNLPCGALPQGKENNIKGRG